MPIHLLGRLYFLSAIVVVEYLFCFGGRGTNLYMPIPGHLRLFEEETDAYGKILIFAFVVFIGLGHFRLKPLQEKISFGRIMFAGHLLCMAVVLTFTLAALQGLSWQLLDPFSYTKSAFYLLGTALLAMACIPLRSWMAAIRATGRLWLYASLAGVAGWWFGAQARLLWSATMTVQSGMMQRATLHAVGAVLGFFLPHVIVDPATFTIGTPGYSVIIASGCSGIEGIGLILVFTIFWLWYSRKECRFPRALLLIPCALICSWLLNIVRLCALILIATAGGSDVAQAGFHAEAGWISFLIIALAFSLAMQKLSWVRKTSSFVSGSASELPGGGMGTVSGTAEQLLVQPGESPAIRAYMLPFLAILVAASASRLTSGAFDWLYPLRFVAAAIALWYFWPVLKKLNWRFDWFALAAGVAVFLIWMTPTWIASLGWAHHPAASRLGADLAALSPPARWAWIAFRVAAAVVTVPISEELAFRGYLARRLISREFDQVSFSSLTVFTICVSSVVFGLEHMKDLMDWQHLALGTLAGVAFAAVLRRRGRMGDAVVAHAVCNLLLAAWVLGFGDWALW